MSRALIELIKDYAAGKELTDLRLNIDGDRARWLVNKARRFEDDYREDLVKTLQLFKDYKEVCAHVYCDFSTNWNRKIILITLTKLFIEIRDPVNIVEILECMINYVQM